jgi:hypothetical protein
MTSAVSPEVLLTAVDMVARVAQEAMSTSQVAKALAPDPRSSSSSSSDSSSSKQSAGVQLAKQEYVPFMVSLLLTAHKCATALCGACPKLALAVAATVGDCRIHIPSNAGSIVWRQGAEDAPKSAAAEWRQLCKKLRA